MKRGAGLTFRIVVTIVISFFVFNIVTAFCGYMSFREALIQECDDAAYRTAKTVALFLQGDTIEEYLHESQTEGYRRTQLQLNQLCEANDATKVTVFSCDEDTFENYIVLFDSSNDENQEVFSYGKLCYEEDEATREIYQSLYTGQSVRESLQYSVDRTPYITSFLSVENHNGEVSAIVRVIRPMNELINGTRDYIFSMLVSGVCVTLLAIGSAYYFMNRQFVQPIKEILEEMRNFSLKGVSKPNGKHAVSRIREINEISDSIDSMEQRIVKDREELLEAARRKEQLSWELSLAAKIQENALPGNVPDFISREELDFYALMDPAKEVGGDFYDFFLLDENHMGIVIADVSEKGIPAALCMMASKNQLKAYAGIYQKTGETISALNQELCKNNDNSMFITAWFGILNLTTGLLEATNAGHQYPLLKRNGKSYEIFKDVHDLVIGADLETQYHSYTIQLEEGDALFLYTDGVSESSDSNGDLYGMERLRDTLNTEDPSAGQKEVLEEVLQSIQSFSQGTEQFDDITMIGMRWFPKKEVSSIEVVPADDSLPTVIAFIERQTAKEMISESVKTHMLVAVDEIFSNIVKYANAKTCTVLFQKEANGIQLVFEDDGIPFDSTKVLQADTKMPIEDRSIGGLGIYIVNQTVDDFRYQRKNDKNVLFLTYKIA